jgi:DNA polymerase-3 subunit alpha (Gram-positive type)
MNNSESFDLINSLPFCVIDLETTGGNHSKDKIIEVGMVRVENLKITAEKSFLINPKMQIPEFIQNLTNIQQKDVKDSPIIEDVIQEILDFIRDDILVAHNTSFDVPFLNGVLKGLDLPLLENKVICTNVMTKHLMPEILNSNLNYMSRLFNVTHSKAHRAQDDAVATANLLITYLNIFIEKGIKKVNQLYYPKNKFELDRIHINSENSIDHVLEKIKDIKSSATLTVKGDRGLILAVIPLEKPEEELDFAASIIKDLDWKIITIKLTKPFIDALFQFNNHFLKYDESVRVRILEYLLERYKSEGIDTPNIDQIDFIVGHHLIAEQVIVYSFLNLNTNTKSLFKIPAQKKKIYQHLVSQVNRFEQVQKGRRRHLLNKEVIPLIQSYLELSKKRDGFLYLNKRDIKSEKDSSIQIIENYVKANREINSFPLIHLK